MFTGKHIKTLNSRTSSLGNNPANKFWYTHKTSCLTVMRNENESTTATHNNMDEIQKHS